MNTIVTGRACRLRCSSICLLLAACFMPALAAQAQTQTQTPPKPEFQYQVDDVRVSIPSPDEPRVKAFGPESLQAAAKYLELGAISWVRGSRGCVNCHTTGPYMTEY